MLGDVWLSNRMVLAVARQVGRLFESLGVQSFSEANNPEDLPEGPIDLLVLGRQHLTDQGYRYGYDILLDVVQRAKPATLVYVVPSPWSDSTYAKDRVALQQVMRETQVLILAIPALNNLTHEDAVENIRRRLEEPPSHEITELFPV